MTFLIYMINLRWVRALQKWTSWSNKASKRQLLAVKRPENPTFSTKPIIKWSILTLANGLSTTRKSTETTIILLLLLQGLRAYTMPMRKQKEFLIYQIRNLTSFSIFLQIAIRIHQENLFRREQSLKGAIKIRYFRHKNSLKERLRLLQWRIIIFKRQILLTTENLTSIRL